MGITRSTSARKHAADDSDRTTTKARTTRSTCDEKLSEMETKARMWWSRCLKPGGWKVLPSTVDSWTFIPSSLARRYSKLTPVRRFGVEGTHYAEGYVSLYKLVQKFGRFETDENGNQVLVGYRSPDLWANEEILGERQAHLSFMRGETDEDIIEDSVAKSPAVKDTPATPAQTNDTNLPVKRSRTTASENLHQTMASGKKKPPAKKMKPAPVEKRPPAAPRESPAPAQKAPSAASAIMTTPDSSNKNNSNINQCRIPLVATLRLLDRLSPLQLQDTQAILSMLIKADGEPRCRDDYNYQAPNEDDESSSWDACRQTLDLLPMLPKQDRLTVSLYLQSMVKKTG